jgi:hypothetical protein
MTTPTTDPEKIKLLHQIKGLQQQLLEAKQQNHQLRQQFSIEPEYALGPNGALKKEWIEEPNWSKEEKAAILETLGIQLYSVGSNFF